MKREKCCLVPTAVFSEQIKVPLIARSRKRRGTSTPCLHYISCWLRIRILFGGYKFPTREDSSTRQLSFKGVRKWTRGQHWQNPSKAKHSKIPGLRPTFGYASVSKTTSKWLLFQAIGNSDGQRKPAAGTACRAFSQLTESWHAEGVTTAWQMSTGASNARTNLVSSAPANRPNSWALPSYSPVFHRIDAHLQHQGPPGLQTPHSGLLMWGISQWDAEVDWDPSFFLFFGLFVCWFGGPINKESRPVNGQPADTNRCDDEMLGYWANLFSVFW